MSVFGAATTSGRFEGRTARRLSTWTRDYLLKHCVDALDQCPHVVLAHSSTALIDASGTVTQDVGYNLATASPSAPERFRSLLYEVGGDDDGGVIRMDVLRRAPLLGSYQHSDRTLTARETECYRQLAGWLVSRASIRRGRYVREQPSATGVSISSIDASVPRRERKVP